MKYLLPLLLLISIFIGLQSQRSNYVSAQNSFRKTSGEVLARYEEHERQVARARVIKKIQTVLARHGSPLSEEAESILQISEQYNLDYKVILGISNAESTLGTRDTCGSYNVYSLNCTGPGVSFGFKSYSEATRYLASTLTIGYAYREFRQTGKVEDIARRYLTGDKVGWVNNVLKIVNELKES